MKKVEKELLYKELPLKRKVSELLLLILKVVAYFISHEFIKKGGKETEHR